MPKEDNSELIQFIGEKFDKVNKKIDNLEGKMGKRFNGMDRKFEKLESNLKEEIRENRTAIDKGVKISKDNKIEIASHSKTLKRHTDHIAQLADTTGTELEK